MSSAASSVSAAVGPDHHGPDCEAIGPLGTWTWVPSAGTLRWSENLFRIFDLEPGEIEPTPEYVFDATHPDDRERVAAVVWRCVTHDDQEVVDYRIRSSGGAVKHLRASIAVADDGEGSPRRLVGSVQDLTAWWSARRELRAHRAVLSALDDWTSMRRDGRRLLEGLTHALDAQSAMLLVLHEDRLVVRAQWASGTEDLGPRPGSERDATARRALRERRPVRDAGATLLPLVHRKESLGVVELRGCGVPVPDASTLSTLTGLGNQLGRFFAHRRAELDGQALAPREVAVLKLAARGHSVAAIAAELHLSVSSVKRAFEGIYARLGVSDRAAAVAVAVRTGLI